MRNEVEAFLELEIARVGKGVDGRNSHQRGHADELGNEYFEVALEFADVLGCEVGKRVVE